MGNNRENKFLVGVPKVSQNVLAASVTIENLEQRLWCRGNRLSADDHYEQVQIVLHALTKTERKELRRYFEWMADERPPADLAFWLNNALLMLGKRWPGVHTY